MQNEQVAHCTCMADLAETCFNVSAVFIGLKQVSEFGIKYHMPQCQLHMFVMKVSFMIWLFGQKLNLHIECLGYLDDVLLHESIPTAMNFFSDCILPKLLRKWYTPQQAGMNGN